MAAVGGISPRLFIALAGGGVAVAAVGFLDDRGSLPAGTRLLVHFVAGAWAVAWVGRVSMLEVGATVFRLGILGYVLSVIAIVWFLNIFNFMDGIDGIAASEAVFMSLAAVVLSAHLGLGGPTAAVAAIIAGASAGFLIWNWPPARIFMGDVGSGYLGFVIGVLALANGSRSPPLLWTWLIVAGVFVVDSTVTIIRRLLRGERLSVAHRTHAYQILAKKTSHGAVTMAVIAIDVIWLMPLAILSAFKQVDAFWIMLVAFCPLAVCAILVGAGQGNG
jgi:Fuc2NAc and GlcNAc transferase